MEHVLRLRGKATVSVMTKTMHVNVIGMVATVVVPLTKIYTALNVNARMLLMMG
jgi:hypothetical protein